MNVRQSPVHQQQAGLAAPDCGTHALFDQQDHLASEAAILDGLWREMGYLIRGHQVGLNIEDDIEEDNENRVERLYIRPLKVSRRQPPCPTTGVSHTKTKAMA